MSIQVTPFIFLDGQAKEAIQFYVQALDAKIVFSQTFGEEPGLPEHTLSQEAKKRIAHSVLKIGDADLFVADTSPGQSNKSGERVQICITTPNVEKSTQFFEALKQGGLVNIPLQKIYFSPAYGMVTDKYGVTFQIFTKRSTE